ncbi:MAG: transcription termination factor Rho [Anaerolineae bacterium]|nr:transcription termination factor Rho [Anaerolineae bacterium]MCB0248134.1 transcription termination factor Rho [Anaerolineae bacterium]MCB9129351.1 transcription termination factor Rho [Anaerolineales bacterium]MCO5242636.1 transcription termination factor Rho [Anaerolineae bacterium]HRX02697.1 transcription termination factor Rho [Anaerolineae bacterium]
MTNGNTSAYRAAQAADAISGWRSQARQEQAWHPEPAPLPPELHPGEEPVFGYLALNAKGWGNLRHQAAAGRNDPFVSAAIVREMGLRDGDYVDALARWGNRGPAVTMIWRVNGHGIGNLQRRPIFENLTAIHPEHQITLGYHPEAITGRVLDLIAPIGRGQRGLIVAPPQAGKTTVLEHIAQAVVVDPDLELLVCLVGERPEEATMLRRSIQAEVVVADLDAPQAEQAAVVDLVMANARRLVEAGRHVVVLLDSLTRLARVHNMATSGRGRTLSGGMEASALVPVRRIFGAARAVEEGGSLTLIATCLVDTNSRLDDLVYEEFKGTGNMEVHLDRQLAQLGLFPAVNIRRSSTRREGLLLDETTMELVVNARRQLVRMKDEDALADLLAALKTYPDNLQALEEVAFS